MMKGTLARCVPLVSRILLAQVFLVAGINKLLHPAKTTALIASHGIPFPVFGCYASAALEVGGALALVLGVRTRWAAIVLAGWAVVVTTVFHWDFTKEINAHLFRNDLAIAGGLLLTAYFGSDR
jgi:putative oxidoreductase